jgi:hypothetical protein
MNIKTFIEQQNSLHPDQRTKSVFETIKWAVKGVESRGFIRIFVFQRADNSFEAFPVIDTNDPSQNRQLKEVPGWGEGYFMGTTEGAAACSLLEMLADHGREGIKIEP